MLYEMDMWAGRLPYQYQYWFVIIFSIGLQALTVGLALLQLFDVNLSVRPEFVRDNQNSYVKKLINLPSKPTSSGFKASSRHSVTCYDGSEHKTVSALLRHCESSHHCDVSELLSTPPKAWTVEHLIELEDERKTASEVTSAAPPASTVDRLLPKATGLDDSAFYFPNFVTYVTIMLIWSLVYLSASWYNNIDPVVAQLKTYEKSLRTCRGSGVCVPISEISSQSQKDLSNFLFQLQYSGSDFSSIISVLPPVAQPVAAPVSFAQSMSPISTPIAVSPVTATSGPVSSSLAPVSLAPSMVSSQPTLQATAVLSPIASPTIPPIIGPLAVDGSSMNPDHVDAVSIYTELILATERAVVNRTLVSEESIRTSYPNADAVYNLTQALATPYSFFVSSNLWSPYKLLSVLTLIELMPLDQLAALLHRNDSSVKSAKAALLQDLEQELSDQNNRYCVDVAVCLASRALRRLLLVSLGMRRAADARVAEQHLLGQLQVLPRPDRSLPVRDDHRRSGRQPRVPRVYRAVALRIPQKSSFAQTLALQAGPDGSFIDG